MVWHETFNGGDHGGQDDRAAQGRHRDHDARPAQTRELIDRAAATVDKSRTEFVLESARERAIDVLLDQRVFQLDAAASAAFAEVLARPPASLQG